MPKHIRRRGKSYEGKLPKVNPKTIGGKCSICKKTLKNLSIHNKRMHTAGNKPKP